MLLSSVTRSHIVLQTFSSVSDKTTFCILTVKSSTFEDRIRPGILLRNFGNYLTVYKSSFFPSVKKVQLYFCIYNVSSKISALRKSHIGTSSLNPLFSNLMSYLVIL